MKTQITFLFAVLMSCSFFGQQNFWKKISTTRGHELKERRNTPNQFLLYHLDLTQIKNELKNAPQFNSKENSLKMVFPDADGNNRTYLVQESSVMEPELQAKFPDSRSYTGWEAGNTGNTIRFSISPEFGMHVMYFDGWDVSYMDSYSKDNTVYILYKRKNISYVSAFECDVAETSKILDQNILMKAPMVQDGQLRTYRIAIAATGEYTTFHGGTVAGAMAAMNTTLTRVSGVFEKTLSVKMMMVANNNLLVYTNSATDPYANTNGGTMLGQNQTNIDNIIGSANYDIGHVFSTGGGGVAYLGSVCDNTTKARGVTGSGAPVGDPFDIDYVAHEIGHQFGANHTFNSTSGACAGNRNAATAYEPGSGSTIMAYAGICGVGNVQVFSDPYFHNVSVNEMYTFVTGAGNSCAARTATGNNEPVANAGSDYSIPKGTAFILTGTGSDPDADAVTYLWEQYDLGSSVTGPPVSTAVSGPAYRSFLPSSSPSRYMPVFSSVLSNNLTPTWEVTPSVARTLNFRLLVSDNRATGGQSAYDQMVVNVTNDGPFTVTSHTTNTSYSANTATVVTWDVAGTNGGTINTQNVDILLSTNNGTSFGTVLAANTPNDGSQSVTLPNINTNGARIMVRAAGNIYYALNSSVFSVTGALATNETESGTFMIYPNPATHEITVQLENRNEKAQFSIHDAAGRIVKQGNFKGEEKIRLDGFSTGNYIITLQLESGKKYSEKLIVKK